MQARKHKILASVRLIGNLAREEILSSLAQSQVLWRVLAQGRKHEVLASARLITNVVRGEILSLA